LNTLRASAPFVILILLGCLLPNSTSAQFFEDDTTGIFEDSLTLPEDTGMGALAPPEDTFVPAYFYNLDDTLGLWVLNNRINYRDDIDRSFFIDAGDFVRFNPSNLLLKNEITPLRSTLSPFNLPGDRINVVYNGRSLNPLEHLVEPDNKINFNDVLTNPVGDIYNIDGPAGMILGGSNATSSMILQPHRPDTVRAESKMLIHSGTFGYANTHGRFGYYDETGKAIYLAAEYRIADGTFYPRQEDSYHQWAEIVYPIKENLRFNWSGRMYRQEGNWPIRPAENDVFLNLFRRDRDFTFAFEMAHSDTRRSLLEYRFQQSKSKIYRFTTTYFRAISVHEHSGLLVHDLDWGKYKISLKGRATWEKFEDAGTEYYRRHGFVSASIMRGDSLSSLVLYLKANKFEFIDPAPTASITYTQNRKNLFISASIGYHTKFPRLYEQYLPLTINRVASPDPGFDYYEKGNPLLDNEKQIIGNLTFGLLPTGRDFLVSLTGGKILDGIDWNHFDTLDLSLAAMRPNNRDIDFFTATARQRIKWGTFLTWMGGASYHYMKFEEEDNPPYSPDFQIFSNGRLYYYFKPFDIHLYAYGEATYHDPYIGVKGDELGGEIIFNAKIMFRIKKFRMYYVFNDLPDFQYRLREDYRILGRYNFFGLEWNFLD